MSAPSFALIDDRLSLYNYDPNAPAAICGAVAFAVVLIAHLWLLSRLQAWYFGGMYAGLLLECIGFIVRAKSINEPTNKATFYTSYIILLAAPSFMSAGCYAIFGRIVWWVTPAETRRSRLFWPPIHVTVPLLIVLVLVCALLQLIGAVKVANADLVVTGDVPWTGLAMLKVGMILQIVGFALFFVIGARFVFLSRYWANKTLPYPAPRGSWSLIYWTIYGSVMVMMIRTVYRLAELFSSTGNLGYLALYEWPFWVLEAIPILGVFVLLVFVHPGQQLPPRLLHLYLDTHPEDEDAETMTLRTNPSSSVRVQGWV
ncbi:hypothetical protein T440DRAFT_463256 [Plenodomus tracheiphilus IPT5]|uniref:RTA1-domain-containing protein n=1 Tax=Plenodomus tracheiphilus IPT5 TaxID=1408161 RepID=A0A6A7BN89_9PLEO|nr:hypothetical protein T440DRAFT_463256 [Plenodomus tracheiphilus IPT5]